MYAYMIGEPAVIHNDHLVLEVNHIGYNIHITLRTASFLTLHQHEQVKIFTYTSVREDAMQLYGFLSMEELNMYKQLITVNGVGPKGAMAILDILSVKDIQLAILSQDSKTLSKASGIGGKTAERIILDLKSRIRMEDVLDTAVHPSSGQETEANPCETEAMEALVALGYSASEAMMAIRDSGVAASDDTEAILKKALKKIR